MKQSRVFHLLCWLLLCLCANKAFASSLTLDHQSSSVPLLPHMQQLEDPDGQLSGRQSLDSPDWQPVAANRFNQGITPATWWLRVQLHNPEPFAQTWWLASSNMRLEHIDLFSFVDGQLHSHEQTGVAHSATAQTLQSPMARLFSQTLQPGETRDLLLRLQSRTELRGEAELWQPQAWLKHEQLHTLALLTAIVILVGTGLQVLAYGLVRRDAVLLSTACWVLFFCLYELAYRGFLLHYLPMPTHQLNAALPITTALLSVIWLFIFLYHVLQLHDSPLWRWITWLLLAFYSCMLGLALFSDLSQAIRWSHISVFAALLIHPLMLARRWQHRAPYTTAFLWAGLIFYIVIVERIFMVLGVLQFAIVTRFPAAYILLVCFVVALLTGLWQRALARSREHIHMQKQLLELQLARQEALEDIISQRSQALQHALLDTQEALQAKNTFLAHISHDLRAPLTSIMGYAQLIAEQDGPSATRKAGIIRKSARRLLDLLNDLIDYAANQRAPQELHLRPLYTHSFLNSVADEARQLATAQGNQFIYDTSWNLPALLLLDSRRMHQVLHNLLGNACKFTRNGEVRLQAGFRSIDTARGHLELTITDTGCGMDPAQLQHVFEPFHQLDSGRKQGGIGLGLSIVKQWVERMQGQIEIQSQPGAGTRVRLEIPVQVLAEQQLETGDLEVIRPPTVGSLSGQGRCVWLIEDSDTVLALLTQVFEHNGFAVQRFSDGEQAMQAIQTTEQVRPDLVITDFYLPGHNGSQLAAVLRQHWPTLPIILLSSGMGDSQSASTTVFDEFILKSMDWSELVEALLASCHRLLNTEHTASTSKTETRPEAGTTQPSPEDVQQLATFLEINAISDILNWANSKLAHSTDSADFYHAVRERARNVDLAALRALLLQHQAR